MSNNDIEKFLSDKITYEMTNNKFGKPVVCITTGEQFMTAMEASRKYKISDGGIRLCCQGKMDTSGRLDDGTSLRWVYWEDYIKMTNEEIESIITTQYQKALKILTDAMPKLHETAKVLFEKEKITGEEFIAIMEN